MISLQAKLILRLDWDKAHVRPLHGFGNRLGVKVVFLVRFQKRPYILRWHESNLVTLCRQSGSKKMSATIGFQPIRQQEIFAV
jgi:hypothetical protein